MKLFFLLLCLFTNCMALHAAMPTVLQNMGLSEGFITEMEKGERISNVLKHQNEREDAERRNINVQGKQTNWGVKAPILGAVFLGSSAFVYLGYKNNEDANRMHTDYRLSKDPAEILVLREAIKSKEEYRNLYYGLGIFGFASFVIVFVTF